MFKIFNFFDSKFFKNQMSITVITFIFQFQLAITNIVYNQGSLGGITQSEKFFWEKISRGQGKNIPAP